MPIIQNFAEHVTVAGKHPVHEGLIQPVVRPDRHNIPHAKNFWVRSYAHDRCGRSRDIFSGSAFPDER